jgi:hypothetical protein
MGFFPHFVEKNQNYSEKLCFCQKQFLETYVWWKKVKKVNCFWMSFEENLKRYKFSFKAVIELLIQFLLLFVWCFFSLFFYCYYTKEIFHFWMQKIEHISNLYVSLHVIFYSTIFTTLLELWFNILKQTDTHSATFILVLLRI